MIELDRLSKRISQHHGHTTGCMLVKKSHSENNIIVTKILEGNYNTLN